MSSSNKLFHCLMNPSSLRSISSSLLIAYDLTATSSPSFIIGQSSTTSSKAYSSFLATNFFMCNLAYIWLAIRCHLPRTQLFFLAGPTSFYERVSIQSYVISQIWHFLHKVRNYGMLFHVHIYKIPSIKAEWDSHSTKFKKIKLQFSIAFSKK